MDGETRASFERARTMPIRVIQIGEGIFLRGFVDWLVHHLNESGTFQGRIAVVNPRPSGAHHIHQFQEQDGLYTVLVRGLQDGRPVENMELVTSVARALDSTREWAQILRFARDPLVEIAVSNTTELGVRYEAMPRPTADAPPGTYPAKLTQYLHERYLALGWQETGRMIVVPCELIDDNGQQLRSIVERHAADWRLGGDFMRWLHERVEFCDTLVDRIVTPYAGDPPLPYEDALAVTVEPYYLFAIRGSERLKALWPFEDVGLCVQYADDIRDFRLQKLRALNGTHTALANLGLMAGLETVLGVMGHPTLSRFVHQLVQDEIVPATESRVTRPERLRDFARNVLERFQNPYLEHNLRSIATNAISKARIRLVPTLLDAVERFGDAKRLTAAIAAVCLAYRPGMEHAAEPDPAGPRLKGLWQDDVEASARAILSDTELWSTDLTQVPGVLDGWTRFVDLVLRVGPVQAVASL
ncbi:Mannitol dehydrogenase domain protein [Alicyclobacillus acidocaldarius subsp. acidocaldarius Tc-4-1]|uniref:Mannitol dehydrogenase domain protein n=1 Tax=Alicyclobacillus acidocaldarius (strain Tc-4-1) TaxID=1048834 RepID=F8IJ83_ALIAT|nr:Mannitol dehydrogenase domain protein [Alicyclobacillus acidocaldarius subsp. acidocaldarius Tc-4-1]